jgi:hypothetical protein
MADSFFPIQSWRSQDASETRFTRTSAEDSRCRTEFQAKWCDMLQWNSCNPTFFLIQHDADDLTAVTIVNGSADGGDGKNCDDLWMLCQTGKPKRFGRNWCPSMSGQ